MQTMRVSLFLCRFSHFFSFLCSNHFEALGFAAMLAYLLHTLVNAADTIAMSAVEFRSFQLIAIEQISPDTKKLKFALQVSTRLPLPRCGAALSVRSAHRQALATGDTQLVPLHSAHSY